jgi:hypothetical protein
MFSINPAEPIDWADLAGAAGYFDLAHFGHEFRPFTGLHAAPVHRSPAAAPARTSRAHAGLLAAAGRLISYKTENSQKRLQTFA